MPRRVVKYRPSPTPLLYERELERLPLAIQVRQLALLQQLRQELPRRTLKPLTTIPYTDYRTFAETIHDFRNVPELRIVLLNNKGKFITEFNVRGGGHYKRDFLPQFFGDYLNPASFLPTYYNASTILVFTPKQVEGKALEQVFRLSENNRCVFDAIEAKFAELPESENKKTNQNRASRLRKILEVAKEYPNGVTHEDLPILATRISVKFIVEDVLTNKTHEYGNARQIVVRLTNTRKNHVDYLTSKEPEQVTQEFLNDLYSTLRGTDKHYLIRNSTSHITNISTPDGNFVLHNPDAELLAEMNKQVKDARYDALKHPELNEFVKQGRVINSTLLHISDLTPDTKLYDMKQAYTKHRECPLYEGFLHQIQQFRQTTEIHGTGIYQFYLHTDTPFSRMLGLHKHTHYILPSPEIRYWKRTLTLSITAGVWGNTTDIHYPTELIQKKLYQKWAGSLSMNDNYRSTKFTFPSTEEFASHVKTLYPETFYWDTKEASVNIPNPSVKVAHHVLAFITSYTRINMLLQMEKLNNIQAVLLDGIYTTDTFENPLFQTKPIDSEGYMFDSERASGPALWYEPSELHTPPPVHLLTTSLLSGSGGSGKTHSILNDKGYIDVLYVVPTHELGKGKHYTTIHKLIGQDCSPYHETYRRPPVILIDELTMIPADFITRALALYPDALIFLAGDMDKKQHYQCRSGNPTEYWDIFVPPPELPIVHYTNDYRAKTEILKQQKIDMRTEMRRVYTDGGLKDTQALRKYVQAHFPILDLDEAVAQATPEDIFMWSTHATEQKIPDTFQKLGVHKSQGQTLTHPKIYITLDWFEYAMPYTALSRATTHSQVQFVSVLD